MKKLLLLLALSTSCGLFAQSQRTFHENGRVKEVYTPVDGRVEMVRYHENGRVAERGSFAGGRPDGLWKQYNAEGRLVTRVRFVNGVRQGRCLLTNHDGSVSYRLRYANNRLLHGVELDANGDVVAELNGR
jgi:antitoxin component YwqK of YwqJK toxin-antitoxin module